MTFIGLHLPSYISDQSVGMSFFGRPISAIELGGWAIGQACEQAAEWQEQDYDLGISVNVSARQLDDPGLLQAVKASLEATGIAPASLTLELTETALMRDPELIAARLQALKLLGVRVAIDDFGTGYSSLAYLHQFPVDALKVDQGFVSSIPRVPQAKALIRTLLQLAASLGVDTIAEGIENEAQLQFLISEGCRCGQGFLLSPPMEAEATRSLQLLQGQRPRPRRRSRRAQAGSSAALGPA